MQNKAQDCALDLKSTEARNTYVQYEKLDIYFYHN
jgi:hypothetical protein